MRSGSLESIMQNLFENTFHMPLRTKLLIYKLFLQDGDPRQNSVAAKRALDDVNAKLFSIPPRSPDINPIENLFHLIQSKLDRDVLARNITKETFEWFSERVKETMENYPVDTIDKIIDCIDGRMTEIIK
ncbi:Hypothetical predicted protein [Paramuricea clavata]|uniref:Uncharacterized protein n=1 Tax=Paramuricea clavata TaxID=317549 RepID=A0A6S7FX66_PARCT|nr:Hypothetical predicted protein [Paramuricea clavata]